jgi:hypothetical protein
MLACARREMTDRDHAAVTHAIMAGVNWKFLLDECRRHGLLPLLSFHLTHEPAKEIPADIPDSLREELSSNAFEMLRWTRELVAILEEFAANGIIGLPYKGPALASLAYGDISLRQTGDLDIFVRRRDFSRASALLSARGYRSAYPLSAARRTALHASGHHELFTDSNDSHVELHWRTMKNTFPFDFNHDALWDRAETVDLGGVSVPSISRSDLLLMLAVHGSCHAWARLEWVASYGELMRQTPDNDWEIILDRARQSRSERVVLVAIALASELLDIPIPHFVAQNLDKRWDERRLAERMIHRLRFGAADSPNDVGYQFAMCEGPKEKLRLALAGLFTPSYEEWALVDLPDPLYPLYYAVRPFRLMRSYIFRHREAND